MRDLEILETFVLWTSACGKTKRRYLPQPSCYSLHSQREADLGDVSPFAKGVLLSVSILKDYEVDPSNGERANFIEVACLRRFLFWWHVTWRSGVFQFRSAADLYWLTRSLAGYIGTLESTT